MARLLPHCLGNEARWWQSRDQGPMNCCVSRLLTQHNQEITQWPPDPFPRERVGSGHETTNADWKLSWAHSQTHAWTEAFTICLSISNHFIPSNSNISFCFRMLFQGGLFPSGTRIVGYARSTLTIDQLKERCKQYLKVERRWLPQLLHFLLL